MDLFALNMMQRLLKDAPYNEFYPDKPVFAYHTGVTGGPQAMVDFYRTQERRPMRTHALGSHANNSEVPLIEGIATTTETAITSYWGGHTSGQASSNGFSPRNGYQGLPSFTQTLNLNNRHFTDEGVFSYQAENGTVYNTIAGMGVVLGEDGYEQGIDLLKIQGNLIVGEVGDELLSSRTQEQAVAWTALTGLSRVVNPTGSGNGDVGYNRVSNTLAFIERSSTTYNYRLHIFKGLPLKLNADPGRLKALLEDAIAAKNGSSYETFDFTWSGVDNVEWHDGTRVIICDDGTFWLGRMAPGAQGLHLGRVFKTAGAWTFQAITSLAATTSYGREQGNPYGVRHMVSEDGKFIAFYSPYYYYVTGGNFFFVPRDTATTATRYRTLRYTDSGAGMSIAPFGGSDFVIGSSQNSDARDRDGVIVRLKEELLTSSTVGVSFTGVLISGWSQSTSYGVSGFVRVQPALKRTTEAKERI